MSVRKTLEETAPREPHRSKRSKGYSPTDSQRPMSQRLGIRNRGKRDGANFTRQPRDAHSAAGNREDGGGEAKRNTQGACTRGYGGRGAPVEWLCKVIKIRACFCA